jgi:hypothetical protein
MSDEYADAFDAIEEAFDLHIAQAHPDGSSAENAGCQVCIDLLERQVALVVEHRFDDDED